MVLSYQIPFLILLCRILLNPVLGECLVDADRTQKLDWSAPVCVSSEPPQRSEEPAERGKQYQFQQAIK